MGDDQRANLSDYISVFEGRSNTREETTPTALKPAGGGLKCTTAIVLTATSAAGVSRLGSTGSHLDCTMGAEKLKEVSQRAHSRVADDKEVFSISDSYKF